MSATVMEDSTMEPLPAPSTEKRTGRRSSGSTRQSGRMPSQLRAVASTNTGSEPGSSSGMAHVPARAGDASSNEPLTLARSVGRPVRPVLMPESREMARLYEDEGLSYRQIGKRFGRAESTVRWHVCYHGVQARSLREAQELVNREPRVARDEILRVADAYARGLTQKAVAQELGLRSANAVRARLRHSSIGLRTRSEALLVSSHPTRLAPEKLQRILDLHGVMPACRVAVEVGVGHDTPARVWLRHGLDVPRGRKAAPRPAYGNFPEHEGVLIAPLSAAVDAYALREPERERDLADAAKVDGRLFRAWRRRERRVTHVGTADRVLVALDRQWWEVFDPDLAPGCFSSVRSRDVVAWSEAMLRACELWGDG